MSWICQPLKSGHLSAVHEKHLTADKTQPEADTPFFSEAGRVGCFVGLG